MRKRRFSQGSVAVIVTLLCACMTAQQASAAPSVSLAPKVMLPSASPLAAGTEMSLRPEQIVLKTKLGWLSGASLEGPVAVQIAGQSAMLPAGSRLVAAIATSRDIKNLMGEAPIYCSAERSEVALGLTQLTFEGAGGSGSRERSGGRLCLADRDGDGRFEVAASIGGKRKSDRQPIAITPALYRLETGMPLAGESEVRLIYQSGSTFNVEVIEAGERKKFSMLASRLGPSTILHSDKSLRVDPKRLPYRVMVGSAGFTVLKLDKEANQAIVRVDRDFSLAPYVLTQGARNLHIYVP